VQVHLPVMAYSPLGGENSRLTPTTRSRRSVPHTIMRRLRPWAASTPDINARWKSALRVSEQMACRLPIVMMLSAAGGEGLGVSIVPRPAPKAANAATPSLLGS
jgi:hypothetical protein